MIPNQLKNQHLLWRAGFGPAAADLEALRNAKPHQRYKKLQQDAAAKPAYLDATDDYLKDLVQTYRDGGLGKKMLDKEERKNLQQQVRYAIRKLNLAWLNEMVNSPAQLREKAAFFWHGHFATRSQNVFHQQAELQLIRENALGSFRTLLFGVSKSAAMLQFLNANQNRKGHPNENFAREVMELFTLGRGNYTENDIKEAARAFTGWGANPVGEFVFRKFQHDDGLKTVLGRSGNFTGEDILNILLEQKQTARFLAAKLYRFYVNENMADKARIDWLADRFFKSDYDISKLLEDILTADWFYDENNIGTRIKSPVELIAGLRRTLPMELENEEAQLVVQRVLGQVLFYPPNVAGWPGGRSWIDSSTLMTRMRLPGLLSDKEEWNVKAKADDDLLMGMMDDAGKKNAKVRAAMGPAGKPIRTTIQWAPYLDYFSAVPREQLVDGLQQAILQLKPSYGPELIKDHADAESREAFIKSATLQIMSTPEYQMC